MIDTSFPPIRLDDADALLRECMRLAADLADLEDEGLPSEWLETQVAARVVLLECATSP